jgi:hypothetical protein
MSETSQTRPACDLRGIREAVCIDTDKITDSCLAKDCIENLRVYLTVEGQCTLDHAVSAKARKVQLLHVYISVEAVPYNTGYYTLDATFYYRVTAEAVPTAGSRPVTISGLAVFTKRLILFGGESGARVFSSRDRFTCCPSKESIEAGGAPKGVVEVVDPMILASSVTECPCVTEAPDLPRALLECFDGELVLSGECKRLSVTIGQFSIARLERETQFLTPVFDYCVPTKECPSSGSAVDDPCKLFSQVGFPMDSFFPTKPDSSSADNCAGCKKS